TEEAASPSPLLRGHASLDRRMAGWDIRVPISAGSAQEAARIARIETEQAARSIWITPATTTTPGTHLSTAADWATLLSDIDLAVTPVVVDADARPGYWLDQVTAGAKAAGHPPEELVGAIRTDIAGTFARDGLLPGSAERCYDDLASAFERAPSPSLHLVVASGLAPHDAGADAAWSLAFMLASAVSTFRELQARGIALPTIASRMELTLGAQADQFMTIAMTRASRLLWAKVLTALGVDAAAHPAFVHVVTGRTTTTTLAPWTNMLRGTNEAAAAAMGGADAITLTPFDAGLGASDDHARRVARNAQLILAREGHLARVADPAGGSAYVEHLTGQLARLAWGHLQQIEAAGGVFSALTEGVIQTAIAETVTKRHAQIAKRRRTLVGVSDYADPTESKLTRAAAEVLPEAAASASDEATPAPSPTCTPLTAYADAAPWRAMRSWCDTIATETDLRPKVFLANLGAIPAHKARAAFARRFAEAIGLAVSDNDGYAAIDPLVAAFVASGADGVVICGSDNAYGELVPALAERLSAHEEKPAFLAVAGRPGAAEAQWRAAGVSHFIFMGMDGVTVGNSLLDTISGEFA
ncbi:MAG: hypothetical protein KC502_23325, partial [Myxococcales bacterium]|nr:hypothetical protein [Myxococcales bacterium]